GHGGQIPPAGGRFVMAVLLEDVLAVVEQPGVGVEGDAPDLAVVLGRLDDGAEEVAVQARAPGLDHARLGELRGPGDIDVQDVVAAVAGLTGRQQLAALAVGGVGEGDDAYGAAAAPLEGADEVLTDAG